MDLLQLEIHSVELYKNMSLIAGEKDIKIRNMANVLAREELRHANIYRQMIEEQKKKPPLFIEDQLIERTRSALLMVEENLKHATIGTINELLEFALDSEIKTGTILKETLELLINNDSEHTNELISIFEKLIIEEQKHANNLKKIIKY